MAIRGGRAPGPGQRQPEQCDQDYVWAGREADGQERDEHAAEAESDTDADAGGNADSIFADIGWNSAAGCNVIADCDAERDTSDCAVRDSNTESDAAVIPVR